MPEDLCKRCGKCCYYGRDYNKPCINLVEKEGYAWCKIYSHRLGSVMGREHNAVYYCGSRGIDEKRIIEGCPYNDLIKRP